MQTYDCTFGQFFYLERRSRKQISTTLRCLFADAEILVPENEFVVGNYEAFGYYRVNYDEKNWKRIVSQLNDDFEVSAKK